MANSLFSTSRPLEQANYGVRLGFWTNWSRGPIFGATLTLTRQQGSLLISFTAFFITIVASRFWTTACLMLHRYFSAGEPRDALHHQRQAIFRNSATSSSGLWSLIQLLYAWRHLAQKRFVRIVPSIIFSASVLLLFALASGFSSSISTAIGDEVLLDATNCGWIDFAPASANEDIQVINPWAADLINNAANYAQQVYSTNGTGVFDNTIFVQRKLNTKSNYEAPCPFRNEICRSNSSNLLLDSGYLDARNDFGINLPGEKSFQIRQVLQCAPLVTEGYKKEIRQNQTKYTEYNYGPIYFGNTSSVRPNYTLIIEDVDTQYRKVSSANLYNGYGLTVLCSQTVEGEPVDYIGYFKAQLGLHRPDADIILIFLSGNGVITPAPTYDPWYRSNVPTSEKTQMTGESSSSPAYRPDEAASPLACAYQEQICEGPTEGNISCGPLGSITDVWNGADSLFGAHETNISEYEYFQPWMAAYANNEDVSRFLWVYAIQVTYPFSIITPILKLGYQSLHSYKSLYGGLQGPLPDDQWKLDVTSWWNISLALRQASFVDSAFGPTYPGINEFKENATNPGQQSICQNQKILSTRHTSVSVFGLYFTYIVGTFIIIISYILEPLLSYAQKRWRYQEYENVEWISNETLHLQRLAYDESGQGKWSNCTEAIPVTDAGELLGPLDLTNLEHPKLGRSSASVIPTKEVPGSASLQPSYSMYLPTTATTPSLVEPYQGQANAKLALGREDSGNSTARPPTPGRYQELEPPVLVRHATTATIRSPKPHFSAGATLATGQDWIDDAASVITTDGMEQGQSVPAPLTRERAETSGI